MLVLTVLLRVFFNQARDSPKAPGCCFKRAVKKGHKEKVFWDPKLAFHIRARLLSSC